MEKIHNYMAESLLSIGATASVMEASHAMHDNAIHSLLVEESGEHIGIITNHDISRKVVSEKLDPEKVQVAAVMSFLSSNSKAMRAWKEPLRSCGIIASTIW